MDPQYKKQVLLAPIKVCYVLSYRDPFYIRTRTVLNALSRMEGVQLIKAVNSIRGTLRYLQTLVRFLRIWIWRKPDCYVIGFRGHEIYWLIRPFMGRKPVIFDALMSPYAALREEQKFGRMGQLLSHPVRWIEALILKSANVILTDTSLHRAYYIKQFCLPSDKVISIPVGAVEQVKVQDTSHFKRRGEFFTVLFYGSFLPLHGIKIILMAAAHLKNHPIQFEFIGGNPRSIQKFRHLAAEIGLTSYMHREWVSFKDLIEVEIPNSDLCLGGPFGNTPQAHRVITGKTLQCLALGKPTVVGNINANYGFVDKKNCLLVEQGKADALASAIFWGYSNPHRLNKIGEYGYRLYREQFSVEAVQKELEQQLNRLIVDVDS